MTGAAASGPRTPAERFVRFAWTVLASNLAVILWGAYVRATGSGAGCGSHWPLCNGQVVPRSPSAATLIEYSHRLSSGVALLLVLALWWWARRIFPRDALARRAAAAAFALMLVEAGVGAGLVLLRLVADNESMARALFMGAHLGVTFLLLAALALTAFGVGRGAPSIAGDRSLARWAIACLAGLLVAGASGAVAALGDTLYPAESLRQGLAADLSATSQVLLRLRVFHPFLAAGAAGLLLLGAHRVTHHAAPFDRNARPRELALQLLVFTQVGAGILNLLLLAPVSLQLVHLLLADLVWIAAVLLFAAPRWRAAGAAGGQAGS